MSGRGWIGRGGGGGRGRGWWRRNGPCQDNLYCTLIPIILYPVPLIRSELHTAQRGILYFFAFPFLFLFLISFALSVVVRKRFEARKTERCTLTRIQAKAYICSSVQSSLVLCSLRLSSDTRRKKTKFYGFP